MNESFLNDYFNQVTAITSFLVIFYIVTLVSDNVLSSKSKHVKTDVSEAPHINILQIIAVLLLLVIIILPIWAKSNLRIVPVQVFSFLSMVLYSTIGLSYIKMLLFAKGTSPLDNDEHYSLFIFILPAISIMQKIEFSQVYAIANTSGSQAVKAILFLFILYLLSSIVIFSLIIYPSTFWATVILKFKSRISCAFYIAKECLAKKLSIPNEYYPLYKQFLSLYRIKQKHPASVTAFPIYIALDLLCYMLLYSFQVFVVLPLAIAVYILSICNSILLFVSQKVAKLSPRRALFFAFRCSIVVAATLVVITVRVLSEGQSDTIASIVEFIASVIVIPVVFQWIQGILEEWRKNKSNTKSNDTREDNNTTSTTASPS